MRGFPKVIANKQDFINLLAEPELKDQAKIELMKIYDLDDAQTTRATTPKDPDNPMSEWNTDVIDNPNPLWKQKGFTSRAEVLELCNS
jgi:hypothetical protein